MIIKGKVVKGLQIGKKIAYPTTNIEPEISENIEFGIYICEVKIDERGFKGVVHYGPKTIGSADPNKIFCEVHIFNFNEEVYGKVCEIKLLKKIRDVRKFISEAALKKQIEKDVKITNKHFNAEQT